MSPPTEAGLINGWLALRSRVPGGQGILSQRAPRVYRWQADCSMHTAHCCALGIQPVGKYIGVCSSDSSSGSSSSSSSRRSSSSNARSRSNGDVEPSTFEKPSELGASDISQQRQSLSGVAPAEALIETLDGLSTSEGRVPKGTSMILGTDTSLEKWKEMDEKVCQCF